MQMKDTNEFGVVRLVDIGWFIHHVHNGICCVLSHSEIWVLVYDAKEKGYHLPMKFNVKYMLNKQLISPLLFSLSFSSLHLYTLNWSQSKAILKIAAHLILG